MISIYNNYGYKIINEVNNEKCMQLNRQVMFNFVY